MGDTQTRLVALVQKLFPDGTNLRFLDDTENDSHGNELHRIVIEYAKDLINLRVPRTFVDNHRAGSASNQKALEKQLTSFVAEKLITFAPNPGPRLRPAIAWTFASDSELTGTAALTQ
jgi:hypothetical protein